MRVLMFQEMLGELFTPVETPEAPNRGFFKGLFGGGAQSLDREELCMPNLHMPRYTVVQSIVDATSHSHVFFFHF